MQPLVFPGLLAFCKQTITAAVQQCARQLSATQGTVLCALDATCGNGHDALFLASLLQQMGKEHALAWRFLGVDVQESAVLATQARLQTHGLQGHAGVHLAGHETVGAYFEESTRLAAAMYNLGYLPGSDKALITMAATTIASLDCVTTKLWPGGVVSVHTYGGHDGGAEEMMQVEEWLSALPFSAWRVARYGLCNKTINQETLFLAQKIQ